MTTSLPTDSEIDYKLALRSAARNYNKLLILSAVISVVGLVVLSLTVSFDAGILFCAGIGLGVLNSQMVQRSLVRAVTDGRSDRKTISFGVLRRLSLITAARGRHRRPLPARGPAGVHRPDDLPDAQPRHRARWPCASGPPGMSATGTILAADLEVGHHHTADIGGLTFNVDTIWSTIIAGAIVLIAAFYMARRATSGRPSKLQLAFETIVDAVDKQVKSSMGDVAPFVVPLAVTLFIYILIANWLAIIPSQGWLEPPSADINFTLALGLYVIIWVHISHIRQKGWRRYFAHYKHGVPSSRPSSTPSRSSSSRSRWRFDSSATCSPARS